MVAPRDLFYRAGNWRKRLRLLEGRVLLRHLTAKLIYCLSLLLPFIFTSIGVGEIRRR